jgi:hypothetical protein
MFGAVMSFGCLVEQWAFDFWCSYGIWMLGAAMSFGCLVELWALDVSSKAHSPTKHPKHIAPPNIQGL